MHLDSKPPGVPSHYRALLHHTRWHKIKPLFQKEYGFLGNANLSALDQSHDHAGRGTGDDGGFGEAIFGETEFLKLFVSVMLSIEFSTSESSVSVIC